MSCRAVSCMVSTAASIRKAFRSFCEVKGFRCVHLQPGVAFSSIVGWQIESSNGAFDFFFRSQKFVLICESLLNSKKNKQTKKRTVM